MKKNRLINAVVFLLIVLLLSGLLLTANGSSTVYLMSVNDKVVPMTPDNMPLTYNGDLYIPYTMLSPQATGIDLGVHARYNVSRGALTVTDGVEVVTFDIRRNTAHSVWGVELMAKALTRNSMVYVPVQWLCTYFGQLNYSLNSTPHGILVRLTNSAVVLDDSRFIDAADDQLRKNLQDYQNAIAPPSSSAVTPTPATPPSPTVTPTPEPVPEVCLAFRWGGQTGQVADLLEAEGQRALFLLDSAQLQQQDDLVRRLVARGHQVGLALYGTDVDQCLSQLEKGRQLMYDICRSNVFIVAADNLEGEDLQLLRDEGCAIWAPTQQGNEKSVSELLRRLDSDSLNYVELTCNYEGVQRLEELLLRANRGGVYLRQAVAPVLLP